jgi:hypothetical protein
MNIKHKEPIDKEAIKAKIEKNRNEIDRFLGVDLPLDIIYFNVRRLSASNERLIKQLS